MEIYNTVGEYLQNYKPDDIIVLAGHGILDGIKNLKAKSDTYKVHKNTTADKLIIRTYRGRKNLTLNANHYNQKVAVISKQEFKKLPEY